MPRPSRTGGWQNYRRVQPRSLSIFSRSNRCFAARSSRVQSASSFSSRVVASASSSFRFKVLGAGTGAPPLADAASKERATASLCLSSWLVKATSSSAPRCLAMANTRLRARPALPCSHQVEVLKAGVVRTLLVEMPLAPGGRDRAGPRGVGEEGHQAGAHPAARGAGRAVVGDDQHHLFFSGTRSGWQRVDHEEARHVHRDQGRPTVGRPESYGLRLLTCRRPRAWGPAAMRQRGPGGEKAASPLIPSSRPRWAAAAAAGPHAATPAGRGSRSALAPPPSS